MNHVRLSILSLSTFLLGLGAVACSTPSETPAGAAPPAKVAVDEPAETAAPVEIPAGTTLKADVDRSTFQFTGSKITGSHTGGFKIYEATAEWGGGSFTSGEIVIDMTSLYTDNEMLTGHMLQADFFDAENHPQATFRTTSFTRGETSAQVTGDLELRGVSQSIEFPAEVVATADGVQVTASFEIDRQRWGVAYPGKPDDLIKDQVPIEFTILFPAP